MAAGDWKLKAIDFAKQLTWAKLALYATAAIIAISGYTVWENRQNLFNKASVSLNSTVDDFILNPPSKIGIDIVDGFMKHHPEVMMMSILDANPINNTRTVVYRTYNDAKLRTIVETTIAETPYAGDGPLFTSDAENNKNILAILNGEFTCSDVSPTSAYARAYPDAIKRASFQCRIPLPPSFGKATGWFTIHMERSPSADILDQLKIESLLMSLNYYNLEVLRQAAPKYGRVQN